MIARGSSQQHLVILWSISYVFSNAKRDAELQILWNLDAWSRTASSQTPSGSRRDWDCVGKTEPVIFHVITRDIHIPSRFLLRQRLQCLFRIDEQVFSVYFTKKRWKSCSYFFNHHSNCQPFVLSSSNWMTPICCEGDLQNKLFFFSLASL